MVNKKQNKCVCEKIVKASIKNSISFKNLPKTEIFTSKFRKSKSYSLNQKIIFCSSCEHLFLRNKIDPKLIYNNDYLTSSTKSFSAKYANDIFLDFINNSLSKKKFKHILEIGSNDLYLIKKFYNKSKKITGIDPVIKSEKKYKKIKTIKKFFSEAKTTIFDKKIDLIICGHTLEHVENPKEFLKKVLKISNNQTDVFFQFPSAEILLNNSSFDQIHHQHLNYFSLKSFTKLMNSIGGKILNYGYSNLHYGALMVHFSLKSSNKKEVKKLKRNSKLVKFNLSKSYENFKSHLKLCEKTIESQIKLNKNFYVIGAGLMSPLINYHMNGIFNKSKNILDDDKSKLGKYFGDINSKIVKLSKTNLKNSVCLVSPVASSIITRKLVGVLYSKEADTIIIPKITY